MKWVAAPISPAEDSLASPRIATTFSLASPPVSATLHVTALGVVDATVNGTPVSDDVLAPGWSAYQHRLAYDSYDVTALLREGDNELAGLLGDGWYRGNLLWGERRHRCHYGDRLALLAQLEVSCADGTDVVVATGPDGWTSTTGAVRSSDLYDGCVTDLTAAEVTGGVTVVDLVPELFVRQGPPVRRTEVLASKESWDGIHDFGQNLAGWVRLTVEGPGTVTVRHAEIVVDGPLVHRAAADREGDRHLRRTRLACTCSSRGSPSTGSATARCPATRRCSTSRRSRCTPTCERTAWFACSDEGLTKLHENVVWGQRGNFLSVPTDCPQRDERLGWTGDIQVFAATACRLYDSRGFLADWLGDLRLEQHENGSVPVVVPDVLTPG